MSNIKSEQLTSGLNLVVDLDQPLTQKEINDLLVNIFGEDNCSYIKYGRKNIVCYKDKVVFLTAATTYVGGNGQHPIFKKRTQFQNWWKDFIKQNVKYDVRLLGVYHYEKNIVFIDYVKDTFIQRKMNSSSAFVYTNDIFQAMKQGVFCRLDVKGNTRYSIRNNKFKEYIEGSFAPVKKKDLFEIFDEFNLGFNFNNNINIIDALKIFYSTKDFGVIRETEWAGWYLENRFKNFISDGNYEKQIQYIGKAHKKKDELDFDIWFDEDKFFGDLKASDINEKVSPGNDKNNLLEVLDNYDRFWYVIYEHSTENETEEGKEAKRLREAYLKSIGQWKEPRKQARIPKYYRKLKLNVSFKSMMILELNRINCNEILSVFNQGVQPNGKPRKPKFNITKRNVENFIVFNYIA